MKQYRLIKCPKRCGGRLLYRPGKWGAFYRCEDPKCRGKMSIEEAYKAEKGYITAMEKQNEIVQNATKAILQMRGMMSD